MTDQRSGDNATHVVHVDGELFDVTVIGESKFKYYWVSGPNPGYGFTCFLVGSIDDFEIQEKHHREAIRGFLKDVDPRTGYLE